MNAQAQFQWNLGGWLGSVIGGTVWILIAALLALPKDPVAGMIAIALFAIPNIVGWAFWRARAQYAAYPCIQFMVLIEGAFGILAVLTLDQAGVWEAIQIGSTVSANFMYAAIAVAVPALMLSFYLHSKQL